MSLAFFIVGFSHAQEQAQMTAEPTKKELKAKKKSQRQLEAEAYKHRFKELLEKGDLVMRATELQKRRGIIPSVNAEANFLKIDENMLFTQLRYREPGELDGFGRTSYGWIQEIIYKDKGPGKALKVRIRYGLNPKGGSYAFMSLTLMNKKLYVKKSTGWLTMGGEWGSIDEFTVDNTWYDLAKARIPNKDLAAQTPPTIR